MIKLKEGAERRTVVSRGLIDFSGFFFPNGLKFKELKVDGWIDR